MSANFPVRVSIEAVDKVTAKVRGINDQIRSITKPTRDALSKVGALRAELGLDPKTISDSFGKVSGSFSNLTSKLQGLGLLALGSGGVLGLLTAGVRRFSGTADELNDVSTKLGVTTKSLQELRFAARQNGMTNEDMDTSLKFLNKSLVAAAKGGGDAAQVYQALGVKFKDAQGRVRGIDEVLPEIADKMKNIQSPAVRAAVAMELFGKNGDRMSVLLGQGSEAIADLRKEANDLGLVIGDEALQRAANFNDLWDKMLESVGGVGNIIAAELVPTFEDLANQIMAFVKDNKAVFLEFGKSIGEMIRAALPLVVSGMQKLGEIMKEFSALTPDERIEKITFALKVLGALAILPTVAAFAQFGVAVGQFMAVFLWPLLKLLIFSPTVLSWLGAAFMTVKAVVMGFGAALLANPITWYIAAIMAVIGVIYLAIKYWDDITAAVGRFWDAIGPIGQAIMKSLFFPITATVKALQLAAGLWDSITGKQAGELSAKGPDLNASQTLANGQAMAAQQNEATVKVDFMNMPRGTQVRTDKNTGVDMEMGMGWAMVN